MWPIEDFYFECEARIFVHSPYLFNENFILQCICLMETFFEGVKYVASVLAL